VCVCVCVCVLPLPPHGCVGVRVRPRCTTVEYPSVLALMLHDIRYGLEFGLTTIDVRPFGVESFVFEVRLRLIDMVPRAFMVTLPDARTALCSGDSTVQYTTVHCSTLQYTVVQYSTVQPPHGCMRACTGW
jgi:hypothetical protein